MILCTAVGIEPNLRCYEMCVLAYRCEALKAWKREKVRENEKDYELATEQMEHDTLYEPTYNQDDGSM